MEEQHCENCGRVNPGHEAYCYACGHILPAGMRAVQTRGLPDTGDMAPQLRWGTAYFGEDTLLRLRVRDTDELIETIFNELCVVGRASDTTTPDIDLTQHQAAELGVSRYHVRMRRETSTIMVEDLGSRNGTFLNGTRLIPYQPRVLRNGDELRLGNLVLRVSFTRVQRPRS